jgi:hypothetical protein
MVSETNVPNSVIGSGLKSTDFLGLKGPYRWTGGKKHLTKSPNILCLDIETKPAIAFIWRMFKENIGVEQVIDPGGVLCFGAKWLGDEKHIFYSEWEHGNKRMLRAAHRLLSEADAVVTYNGDKFDLPKLKGEFVLNDLSPLGPNTSIDVYKAVKKLGLLSNKLAFVGPYLKLGQKIKHEGFGLWRSVVLDKDRGARERMQEYCLGDVDLLEEVYVKMAPHILNHPHLGESGEACGTCGSKRHQKRGFRYTKSFRIQRLQCQGCGSWQDGKREKIK